MGTSVKNGVEKRKNGSVIKATVGINDFKRYIVYHKNLTGGLTRSPNNPWCYLANARIEADKE